MKKKQAVLNSILNQGMLPLFFYEDAQVSADIMRTLYRAGVRVMEYTNRAKEAFDNFVLLKAVQEAEMPDLLLGIGTVKTEVRCNELYPYRCRFYCSPNC